MNRGAFAAVIDGDKVLLVKTRTHNGYDDHWSFPGGVVEEHETNEQGAVREVAEETGIDCKIQKQILTIQNLDDDITVHIFVADYVTGDIVIDTVEIKEARWFTKVDALKLDNYAYNNKEVINLLFLG